MPRISVIVPVYKVEKYLKECIDSILAQTYSDFELILIDDGSPDCCGEICDVYAKRDKRIKVIHQENMGVSAARNVGLDISEGKFITFIDSDDLVSIYYIEELYQSLILEEADISVCNYKKFKKNNTFDCNNPIQKHDTVCLNNIEAVLSLYDNNLNGISITPWGKIFKREIFNNLRFPVGKIHEDEFIIPIAIYRAKKIVWLKSPLYGYRERENSIMHRKFTLERYDDLEGIAYCREYFFNLSEIEIVNAIIKRKLGLFAYYSLLARKSGIYKTLPKKYKISRIKAICIIKTQLPYDSYSYLVAKIYPRYISVEAHIRRVLQIIGLFK